MSASRRNKAVSAAQRGKFCFAVLSQLFGMHGHGLRCTFVAGT